MTTKTASSNFFDVSLVIALSILFFYIFSYCFTIGYYKQLGLVLNLTSLDYSLIVTMLDALILPFLASLIPYLVYYLLPEHIRNRYTLVDILKYTLFIFLFILYVKCYDSVTSEHTTIVYFLGILLLVRLSITVLKKRSVRSSLHIANASLKLYQFVYFAMAIYVLTLMFVSWGVTCAKNNDTFIEFYDDKVSYYVLTKIPDAYICIQPDSIGTYDHHIILSTEDVSNKFKMRNTKYGKVEMKFAYEK